MANNGARSRYLLYRRRKRGKKGGPGLPRWLLALIAVAGLGVISVGVLAGVSAGVYRSYANDLRPPDEAIAELPQGGARLYDRNGTLLFEFLDDEFGIREPVPLNDISLFLIAATISAEDASFMDNPGVNFRGLASAAWDNLSPFSDTPGFLEGRGGSSITQQLVKNVYFDPDERTKRTVERKIKETVLALELTRTYEKEQILEWYLNLISYGNIYNGAEAAAQGYFSKSARNLTLAEAATLAAIPSCPSCYDPINKHVAARAQRNVVLKRMFDEGYISGDMFWEAAAQPLELDLQPFPVQAPHWVFNVVKPQLERIFGKEAVLQGGLEVFTTLDLSLQRKAEGILEKHISGFEAAAGGNNGAFVAIDPETAQVLVYVGSRDYFRDDILGKNDVANAENSPGSSFKPFTYLTAFMELGWGPGTFILDTAISIDQPGADPFRPSGPGGFAGPMTIRSALGNSKNVPPVKTMLYTTVDAVVDQAQKMGITTFDNKVLGPALTTGGGDVKLVDQVYAYTVLANNGLLKGVPTELDLPPGNRELDPVSILRVENRDGDVLFPIIEGDPEPEAPTLQEVRVAPATAAYMVTDILVDPEAERLTFGNVPLGLPDGRPFAAKTGTSRPYENTRATGDTWTFAYTPQLVAGTWYGNADNSPLSSGASSTSNSWPIIKEFMTEFHSDLPVEQFTRPEGLVETSVCVLSGAPPSSDCPRTTPKDFFDKESLPEELQDEDEAAPTEQPGGGENNRDDDEKDVDTWWERVEIDTRTDKLASDLTQEEFRQTRFFLQLPEGLSGFERGQALEWARVLGAQVGEAPTEVTEESDVPLAITSPANGTEIEIGDKVIVTGRANSTDFQSFRLEYEADATPGATVRISESSRPVGDGRLGTWETDGLAPGAYTIRLIVRDEERGDVTTEVRVVLAEPDDPSNGGGGNGEDDSNNGRGRGPPGQR